MQKNNLNKTLEAIKKEFKFGIGDKVWGVVDNTFEVVEAEIIGISLSMWKIGRKYKITANYMVLPKTSRIHQVLPTNIVGKGMFASYEEALKESERAKKKYLKKQKYYEGTKN